jgi:DNA-binding NarL/FixJ family response regulator
LDLSPRELEILKLVCENLTNEEIAEKVNLSYDTVKWHRSNILSKTGCKNALGLLIFAIKNKIVEIK